MKTFRVLILLALLVPIFFACSKNYSVLPATSSSPANTPTPTPTVTPTPSPTPGVPGHYIALGDSISYGSDLTDTSLSFVNLLFQNNNTAYPADSGQDLSTKYPGIQLLNLSIPGARTQEVISNELPSIPQGSFSPYYVSIIIGGNELITPCGANYTDPPCDGAVFGSTVSQGTTWSYNFKTRLKTQIVQVLQNTALYPGIKKIVLGNIYDPTDGTGLAGYGWAAGEAVLAQYNLRISEVASETGVDLVDVYTPFLGHGTQYNNTSNPYYVSSDPTYWYVSAIPIPIHPNALGHYHLKHLFWPHF